MTTVVAGLENDNQYIQVRQSPTDSMSLECDHDCPVCGEPRTFYRAASTTLNLGEKIKWRCPDCEYSFITIDGDIDSSATA